MTTNSDRIFLVKGRDKDKVDYGVSKLRTQDRVKSLLISFIS